MLPQGPSAVISQSDGIRGAGAWLAALGKQIDGCLCGRANVPGRNGEAAVGVCRKGSRQKSDWRGAVACCSRGIKLHRCSAKGCKSARTFPEKEEPGTGVRTGHETGALVSELGVQLPPDPPPDPPPEPLEVERLPPQPIAADIDNEIEKSKRIRGALIIVSPTRTNDPQAGQMQSCQELASDVRSRLGFAFARRPDASCNDTDPADQG